MPTIPKTVGRSGLWTRHEPTSFISTKRHDSCASADELRLRRLRFRGRFLGCARQGPDHSLPPSLGHLRNRAKFGSLSRTTARTSPHEASRAFLSTSSRIRHRPCARSGARKAPMRTRTSRSVGCPTAAVMRRTCRLRPSVSSSEIQQSGTFNRNRIGGSRGGNSGAGSSRRFLAFPIPPCRVQDLPHWGRSLR